ncbi:MAG: sigma factor-like helix-turn-helix DNA-binding protein [Gaiellaceae bacterium]
MLLRGWQGLSYREIALELGLTRAAVETLLFRARRSLARGLDRPQARRRRLGPAPLLAAPAGAPPPLVLPALPPVSTG